MNRWPFIKQYIKSISCSWKHFWNVCAFDKYCMSFNSSVIRVSKHRESITTRSRKSPTSRLRFQFCPDCKRLLSPLGLCRTELSRLEEWSDLPKGVRGGGGGVVGVPERRGAVVVYTITMRVYGDVLEVFWSYCSEVGFFKVLRNKKRRIWVRSFLLTYIPIRFLECLVCVGLRELWLWSLWIPLVKSRLGEQKDLIECRFLSSHHKLLIKKQTAPTSAFPCELFCTIRAMNREPRKLDGWVWNLCRHPGFCEANNAAVSCFSLYEMRARSSESLLSSDWKWASKMVGRRGRKAWRLSLTRTPALFPLFPLRFLICGRVAQTKGSSAVFVNKAPALRNSKFGFRCATISKCVCLSWAIRV